MGGKHDRRRRLDWDPKSPVCAVCLCAVCGHTYTRPEGDEEETTCSDKVATKVKLKEKWLTTMDTAMRYGVATDSLRQWRRWKGFPEGACIRFGVGCVWDNEAIDAWLRTRPVHAYGPKPNWLEVINA